MLNFFGIYNGFLKRDRGEKLRTQQLTARTHRLLGRKLFKEGRIVRALIIFNEACETTRRVFTNLNYPLDSKLNDEIAICFCHMAKCYKALGNKKSGIQALRACRAMYQHTGIPFEKTKIFRLYEKIRQELDSIQG